MKLIPRVNKKETNSNNKEKKKKLPERKKQKKRRPRRRGNIMRLLKRSMLPIDYQILMEPRRWRS